MKEKIFTIRFEENALHNMFDSLRNSLTTGRKNVKKDIIATSDLDIFEEFSKDLIKLYMSIFRYKPRSASSLAKSINKDQGNVLKQLRRLEGIGLIELKKEVDGNRERYKPIPLYTAVKLEAPDWNNDDQTDLLDEDSITNHG